MIAYDKLPRAIQKIMTQEEYGSIQKIKSEHPRVRKLMRRDKTITAKPASQGAVGSNPVNYAFSWSDPHRMATLLPFSVIYRDISGEGLCEHPVLLLHSILGEGSSGRVKLGFDLKTGQYVSVKVLVCQGRAAPDGTLLNRWARVVTESSILNRLKRLHGLSESPTNRFVEEKVYMVARLIEGVPLHALYYSEEDNFSNGKDVLGVSAHLRCLEQLVDEISYHHNQGIIHRDLKLDNVIVSVIPFSSSNTEVSFCVSLIDFADAHCRDVSSSDEHKFAGTVNYIAPEIYAGQRACGKSNYTIATECYAMGQILEEAFLGVLGVDDQRLTRGFLNILLIERDLGFAFSIYPDNSKLTKELLSDFKGFVDNAELLTQRCKHNDPEMRLTFENIKLELSALRTAYEDLILKHKNIYQMYQNTLAQEKQEASVLTAYASLSRVSSNQTLPSERVTFSRSKASADLGPLLPDMRREARCFISLDPSDDARSVSSFFEADSERSGDEGLERCRI